MTKYIRELIDNLDESFNELGADILLMESVIIAVEGGNGFTEEGVDYVLERLRGYVGQHIMDIENLTQDLLEKASPSRQSPVPGPARQPALR